MRSPLPKPIDHINEERPQSIEEESAGPFLFTAAVCICMILILAWLFVPGRVSTARARPSDVAEDVMLVPPAQRVHERLERNDAPREISGQSIQPSY